VHAIVQALARNTAPLHAEAALLRPNEDKRSVP